MSGSAAPMIVAATWLSWRGDAVLAVRPHGLGVFFLPGGLPEPGETMTDAVAREVSEEVGISIDPMGIQEAVRVESDAYGRPGTRVLLVGFEGPGTGSPQADDDEIAEIAWLQPARWTLLAPAARMAVEQALKSR